MIVRRREVIHLRSDSEIVRARQAVRAMCTECGFSLVDQTKMVTASSELARNTVDYAGGGAVLLETLRDQRKSGVRLVFEDHGPGIPDIDLALRDGYTSGNGMGLGLGGAKRLSHEFEITSTPGIGTRIAIVRWK